MNRNTLYFIVGGLVVVVLIIGYFLYKEQNTSGIEVKVNDNGISVETK